MKKRSLFLFGLAAFLSFGLLGGCGGALSSFSLSSSASSAQSSPSSNHSVTSSNSVASSNSISEEEALDLTLLPRVHEAVTPTDDEVVQIVSVVEKGITISQIDQATVLLIKNIIKEAYLTPEKVTLLVMAANDVVEGIKKNTWGEASVSFQNFYPHLQAALSEIDGDQIGYLLREFALLAQKKREQTSSLPYGLFLGLENAKDYQGALAAFGTKFPGFKSQYELYSSYFDGSVAYQENPLEGLLTPDLGLALALGRSLHLLLEKAIALFSPEEKVLALASLALTLRGENLPYAQEVKAKLAALKDNPVASINHLGSWLLSFKITKASWALLQTKVVDFLKMLIASQKHVELSSRAVNVTYFDALISFVEQKKNLIQGEMVETLIKLLGLIAEKFSSADYQAILASQGDNPVNPLPQLLSLYEKAYASLAESEKTTLTSLFTQLGLSYEEVITTLKSWQGFDLKNQSEVQTMKDYLSSLGEKVVSLFTPSVKEPQLNVYLQDPFCLKNSTIAPKRFAIYPHLQNDSSENYAILDVVAPTDTLGFHQGSFVLKELATNATYTYIFGYDVIPTFLGLDPLQYLSFTSQNGQFLYANNVLYLHQGVSLEEIQNQSGSNVRFLEGDAESHGVALTDPGLSLTLSSTEPGEGYLLLAYTVSSELTIYGVIKTRIFTDDDIFYSNGEMKTYVVLGGDTTVLISQNIIGVHGETIELAYFYLPLTALHVSPNALGEGVYQGHYSNHIIPISLVVLDPAVCHLDAIGEYLSYLKTSYFIGEAFSLTALQVFYSYQTSGGESQPAGSLLIQNPQVTLQGFSTQEPVAQAEATFVYGGISVTFSYSVTRSH